MLHIYIYIYWKVLKLCLLGLGRSDEVGGDVAGGMRGNALVRCYIYIYIYIYIGGFLNSAFCVLGEDEVGGGVAGGKEENMSVRDVPECFHFFLLTLHSIQLTLQFVYGRRIRPTLN